MARLVYSVIASLDGYVADANDDFSWAAPSPEVHRAVNDLEASVGTYLYGRRMYDVMAAWQDMPGLDEADAAIRDFATIWQSANKVVYSTTLDTVTTPRTQLERVFDARAVRDKVDELDRDVSIGGPTLASHALRAGIVDELHQFVVPVIVGAGTSCWPIGARLALNLRGEHRFTDGTVHLHYRVLRPEHAEP